MALANQVLQGASTTNPLAALAQSLLPLLTGNFRSQGREGYGDCADHFELRQRQDQRQHSLCVGPRRKALRCGKVLSGHVSACQCASGALSYVRVMVIGRLADGCECRIPNSRMCMRCMRDQKVYAPWLLVMRFRNADAAHGSCLA